MATITYTDAQLPQDFRALFRLTLEDIDPKTIGISCSTWARIKSGAERMHTPGVTKKIGQIRALTTLLGTMPYREARRWAISPSLNAAEDPARSDTPKPLRAGRAANRTARSGRTDRTLTTFPLPALIDF
jgi:hypothetical protein